MKKLLMVFALLAMVFAANAQLFVAGSFSAYHYDGSTSYKFPSHTVDLTPVENGFVVMPAVGYMIPGKSYGFGLSLGYAYASVKDDNDRYVPENGDVLVNSSEKDYSNTFDIAPFFRYAYARFDKITLYVDAKLPIGISDKHRKIGGTINPIYDSKTFAIGARLIPGLTYKFNDHILFTTEIGLLSINYLHTKTTTNFDNVISRTNEFMLGANTRTVASFGFVYLF